MSDGFIHSENNSRNNSTNNSENNSINNSANSKSELKSVILSRENSDSSSYVSMDFDPNYTCCCCIKNHHFLWCFFNSSICINKTYSEQQTIYCKCLDCCAGCLELKVKNCCCKKDNICFCICFTCIFI
jgi:hypothetical protein